MEKQLNEAIKWSKNNTWAAVFIGLTMAAAVSGTRMAGVFDKVAGLPEMTWDFWGRMHVMMEFCMYSTFGAGFVALAWAIGERIDKGRWNMLRLLTMPAVGWGAGGFTYLWMQALPT